MCLFTAVSKASVNIARVPRLPLPPCPMWVHEILERHMNHKEEHHTPLTMLRWSVRLMDTQASLKAKRTPDDWEGSPRLKWITLKQNILSQIGLCLNSLLLLGEGKERVPPAPWLVKDTDSLIRQTSLQTSTYTLITLFSPQQSKYRVKHNWAIVLVMHNVYASQNRRKIEKVPLLKFPQQVFQKIPTKAPREAQENNT